MLYFQHSLLEMLVIGFLPGFLIGLYWGRAQKVRAAILAVCGGIIGMAGAFSLSGYAGSMGVPMLQSPFAMMVAAIGAAALLMTIIGKAEYKRNSYDE
ncbi:MAG: hypothetical protein ABL898_00865 [Hyphomicrobiaceae bacterium]|nr:hypothetical protein [Hyphomicrobiaceae bacterium]